MSLNWDLTKTNRRATGKLVANCDDDSHDEPCKVCPQTEEKLIHTQDGQPIPWAITNGLIWATMAVQMGDIKDAKAAREFAVRLAVYQKLFGPFLSSRDGKGRAISTAEVMGHVGMRTNVTNRSRGQFLKAMGENLAREIEREEFPAPKDEKVTP